MSQLLQILTDTAVFHRRHKAVGAMVWLTSSIATAVLTVPHRFADIPAFVVIATLMGATVIFWLVVGCFFLVPNFFAEAISAIQKVTPAQAASAIPMLVQILVLAAVLTLGAHFVIGRRFGFFGFANQFDQACRSRVRRAVACAADGEVSLYRFEGDTFIAPDELSTVLTKR